MKCLPQVIGGVHLHVRTCAPLSHLYIFRLPLFGNGCADCAEIWYALRGRLVTAYAAITGGVSLHARSCTPRFCISGTARPIEFNFGV